VTLRQDVGQTASRREEERRTPAFSVLLRRVLDEVVVCLVSANEGHDTLTQYNSFPNFIHLSTSMLVRGWLPYKSLTTLNQIVEVALLLEQFLDLCSYRISYLLRLFFRIVSVCPVPLASDNSNID
jgi:hypothetical protein